VSAGDPTTKPSIGIIGGIASGKSTVASELAKLGCAVISADAIVCELFEEASIRDELVRLFGPWVITAAGKVDRKKLAATVFADGGRLRALNALLHPPALRRAEDLIARYQADCQVVAIVLDVPLLVEVGWVDRCDRLLFVKCDWQRRIERARLSQDEIRKRENFQISLDRKEALADNVIDNNSDFSALVRQIKTIFSDITKG
jgi:dephospho-CoA kinase